MMNQQENDKFRKKKVTKHARLIHQLETSQSELNVQLIKDNHDNDTYIQSIYDSLQLDYASRYTLTANQSSKLITNLFFEFYKANVFYQVEKRKQIFCHLLSLELYFEKSEYYPLFLLMSMMYYVTTSSHFYEVSRIRCILQMVYLKDTNYYTFDDLVYLQYSALHDHYTLHNKAALEKLLIVKQHAHSKHMNAMNEYYLAMVYLSLRDTDAATKSNILSAQLFLATSNINRWLHNDMSKAKIFSATGRFNEALAIYGNCLNGVNNLQLLSLSDDIIECMACNELYAGQYERSLQSLKKLYHSKYGNDIHYLYALNYFYLEMPHLALKWLELGKLVPNKSQTSIIYLELIELLLFSNSTSKIIRQLKKMEKIERQGWHYGSYYFINQLLNTFENMTNKKVVR